MWPFKKKENGLEKRIEPAVAASLLIATIALVGAVGVARWSWLLLDEQTNLRRDFVKLQNDQQQTYIQYEFWLNQLKQERLDSTGAGKTPPTNSPVPVKPIK